MVRFRRKARIHSRVYIVDDNELDLKVLTQEFELRSNYEVKAFMSGDSFLKDLISNPPNKKLCNRFFERRICRIEQNHAEFLFFSIYKW